MARITIPYAVADFIDLRERGFYYVDKTDYIPKLEDYNAPVFLRPRRFGKSLLVSTLACYYDRTKAHRFEELFGGTCIIGGLVSFSALFSYNPVVWLCLFILIAGILGSARIVLGHHTLGEVLSGFVVGLVCAFLVLLSLNTLKLFAS